MKTFTGWSIKITTQDWVALMGILFVENIRLAGDLLAIRTMVFRTRQQARDCIKQRLKGSYNKAQVVKVKVTIEEIS